jgi:hypothetical protein
MSWFYYKAISSMNSMAGSEAVMAHDGYLSAEQQLMTLAARRLTKFGLLVLGGFLLTFGPVTISAFLNVLGVELPLEWEMFAGLATKLKGALDCAILLNLPVLQKRRKAQRVGVASGSAPSERSVVSRPGAA